MTRAAEQLLKHAWRLAGGPLARPACIQRHPLL